MLRLRPSPSKFSVMRRLAGDVAVQLGHRKWDTALLTGGTARHDILASHAGGPAVKVQVKTTSAVSAPVGAKIEQRGVAGDREWVVLVRCTTPPSVRGVM
jgi:hypothetical protein